MDRSQDCGSGVTSQQTRHISRECCIKRPEADSNKRPKKKLQRALLMTVRLLTPQAALSALAG